MTQRSLNEDDALEDFEHREITLDGVARVVHVAGTGPGVIVMSEMPGISPHVARFSRWVRDAGLTVYMPSLFGRDGAVANADEGAAVFRRACVSAEFRAFAGRDGGNRSSPVTHWLRALARLAHQECGGPGVGAIGMCWTGNFALSMMLEPAMLAPVLSQPSLPLDDPGGIEIAPADISAVRERLDREDLSVLAFRFEGDRFCRAERFAAYAAALGDRFVARVLPDHAANTEVPPFFAHHVPTPHSVVTAHLIDEAGQPTVAARDEILAFLVRRLVEPRTLAPNPGHAQQENPMSQDQRPVAIHALEAAVRAKPTSYPEPFASRMAGRVVRPLGDVFGLSNFGVNLTLLAPGAVSALRHAHRRQDEFVYIVAGSPTLVTDAGETPLQPGMCAGFRAGSGDAHRLINRADHDCLFLVVGDRTAGDSASYPDDDLVAQLGEGGQWRYLHKNGEPY